MNEPINEKQRLRIEHLEYRLSQEKERLIQSQEIHTVEMERANARCEALIKTMANWESLKEPPPIMMCADCPKKDAVLEQLREIRA